MLLLKLFFFIWRCWLWFSVLFGLIVFSPIGVILISFKKTYPLFHLFCRWWCRIVLLLNGFWSITKFEFEFESASSYILCPNHTSKFDIILLFATFPKTFVFIGKKGVSKFLFFEWFYNKTMITFDRDSIASAFRAYRKADNLLKSGVSIVIFPEGRVPKNKIRLGEFKAGAFKLAINNKVPIIPITFVDNKKKYPEDKLNLSLGLLRVFIHKPINTNDMSNQDTELLKNKVFSVINNKLIEYEN
ncbi:MAG: 1-acyl-sn-glycerol-3-phosphate acyltransferase [Flavobacteriales bacterium]|jgi:1-acyl-sn-glycerol-3-phosphate acyltransferase|nr:1-acyl-sn-glycerol-3-phosphate acyltransferase [Flavobacteriales bacterium]|tara:strand:+ start:14 stop:748 length:735 start_codon:yes stop_codon:yes gene_type:complete